MRTQALTAVAMLLALAACSQPEATTAEGGLDAPDAERSIADELAAHRGGQTSSTVRWNRESIALFRSRLALGGPPPGVARTNTYLGLAQFRAVKAARHERGRARNALIAGAVAGASVVVLRQFYPLDLATIDTELAAQRAEYQDRPARLAAFDAGEAMGRQIGAAALAEAASDNFNVAPVPPAPIGPGYWFSSGAPTVKGNYGSRLFFLHTPDEINSPPPPAFGSPAFLDALAEVKAFSAGRTPEQAAVTLKWVPFSTPLFSDLAADLVDRHYRGELEASRIFAYANVAAFDAITACFTTKFTYWFIRPTQADPSITVATPLPNHPSYPSAHSCQSGAWQAILGDAFPSERRRIDAMAEEASLSRVMGGLHYRFDGDAGLALGREAGRLALERGVH